MGLPGHTAAAFAAKALDLLCFPFPATGIEHTGADPWLPWSHGLFMTAVWSLVAGAIAPVACRDGRTGAAIALLVLSHWVFGFVSHWHDLPLLFARSPLVGLGIESSLAVGLVMELSLLALGVAIYLVTRRRTCRKTPGA